MGDLDGDGKPDVLAPGPGATLSMFINTTPDAGATPSFGARIDLDLDIPWVRNPIVVADFNRDGKLDIAFSGVDMRNDTVAIALNATPPGVTPPSFAPRFDLVMLPELAPNPGAIAIGDFDGDGSLDVAGANDSSGMISIFLNQTPIRESDLRFSPAIGLLAGGGPIAIALADLDVDGKADLVVSHISDSVIGEDVAVFLDTTAPGAATAGFASKLDFPAGGRPGTDPRIVAIADVNGDGLLDFIVATTTVSVSLASEPLR